MKLNIKEKMIATAMNIKVKNMIFSKKSKNNWWILGEYCVNIE